MPQAIVEVARENLPQFRDPGQKHPSCGGQEADIVLDAAGETLELFDFGHRVNGKGHTARSYTTFALAGGADAAIVHDARLSTVRICGGDGADSLRNDADDVRGFYGGAASDELRGGRLRDTLKGNLGNDRTWGGPGADVILGGPGADTLRGQGGRDSIEGGDGNDQIFGNRGDDTLVGQNGNDGGDGIDGCWAESETSCEY